MIKKYCFAALLALVCFASAAAQTDSRAIYLWVRGDLLRVDPAALVSQRVTDSGAISAPALAPDETRIAYRQASAIGLEALDRVTAQGEIADIDLPTDIVVYDTRTGDRVTIATQPDDAALFVEGVPDRAVVRSAPAWSPDGMRLAWTEFDWGVNVPRLVVYDLLSSTTSIPLGVIDTDITQGQSPGVRWGGDLFIINLSADAAGEQHYLLVSVTGTINAAPRVAPVSDDYVLDFFAVEGESRVYAGLLYASGRWTILDGQTGVGVPFVDVPHLVSRHADGGSLRVRFDITPDMGMFWEARDTTMAFTGSPSRVTLSPAGDALAFIGYPTFNGAAIWRGESITEIPNTGDTDAEYEVGAVLWGATAWRIDLP